MTLSFRIKFFFQKRITPISVLKWDIKSIIKGYRKHKYAEKYVAYSPDRDEPIDLQGKQHVHIYPIIACNLNCHFCQL